MTPIDWTKPAADILQELLAIVERRLPLSEAWATGARGLRDFGPGGAGWGGMLAKLKQIGYSDVADQMVSGLDFGDPQVQSMITQLGAIEPDTFTSERVEILKSWGVDCRPRWSFEAFESHPTLQQVEKRKVEVNFRSRKINAIALFDERMNPSEDAGEVMAQAWIEAAN